MVGSKDIMTIGWRVVYASIILAWAVLGYDMIFGVVRQYSNYHWALLAISLIISSVLFYWRFRRSGSLIKSLDIAAIPLVVLGLIWCLILLAALRNI